MGPRATEVTTEVGPRATEIEAIRSRARAVVELPPWKNTPRPWMDWENPNVQHQLQRLVLEYEILKKANPNMTAHYEHAASFPILAGLWEMGCAPLCGGTGALMSRSFGKIILKDQKAFLEGQADFLRRKGNPYWDVNLGNMAYRYKNTEKQHLLLLQSLKLFPPKQQNLDPARGYVVTHKPTVFA